MVFNDFPFERAFEKIFTFITFKIDNRRNRSYIIITPKKVVYVNLEKLMR